LSNTRRGLEQQQQHQLKNTKSCAISTLQPVSSKWKGLVSLSAYRYFTHTSRVQHMCVAACCSVLQRVAACCSVLQRVVVRYSVFLCVAMRCCVPPWICTNHVQQMCVAVCCSVLQCRYSAQTSLAQYMYVAMCCSLLQCVTMQVLYMNESCLNMTVCRSVLQCVAVCWSVLQCGSVCCGVLQCVAACCSAGSKH